MSHQFRIMLSAEVLLVAILAILVFRPQAGWKELFRGFWAPARECAGHGVRQVDTGECQCHQCFHGPLCRLKTPEPCTLSMETEEAWLFEGWWESKARKWRISVPPSVPVPIDFRVGAQPPPARFRIRQSPRTTPSSPPNKLEQPVDPFFPQTPLGERLVDELEVLHGLYPNINPDSYHVVTAAGTDHLLRAAVWAYGVHDNVSLSTVLPLPHVWPSPRMNAVTVAVDAPHDDRYHWLPHVLHPDVTIDVTPQGPPPPRRPVEAGHVVVSLLASPNDPDGDLRFSAGRGGGITVRDLSAYWPHLLPDDVPVRPTLASDVAVFSFAKLTGHMSTGFSWAFVRDARVGRLMQSYQQLMGTDSSVESQYRALHILRSLTADKGKMVRDFFRDTRKTLKERWTRLRRALDAQGLAGTPPVDRQQGPMVPAGPNIGVVVPRLRLRNRQNDTTYAWLQCMPPVLDCVAVFRCIQVSGASGPNFGVGPDYVRLNMLVWEWHFNTFMKRLAELLQGEVVCPHLQTSLVDDVSHSASEGADEL